MRAYWICRQEEGLAAPVKCGESNRALTRCLDACTGDADKFRAFKARRLDEMEVAATSGIAPFGKPKQ